MLNAGMSYTRFLRPYLIAALFLSGIYLLGNHVFFPRGNKTMMAFENKYIFPGNYKVKSSNIHLFIGPESKVYIDNYLSNDSSGTGFRLEQYQDLQLTFLLRAKSFEYLPENQKWRLHDYETRYWEDGKEYYISGIGASLDTAIALYPSDFVYYTNDKEMMTSKELLEYIQYEQERGIGFSRKMRSEYHRRWAEPFTIVILTVIGASVASRKQRGGMGLNLAIGAVIGAVFVLMSKFALTFSTNLHMNPMIAMWLPNILFSGLAIYMVSRAQQ